MLDVLGLHGKVLVVGGCWGYFCEKPVGASPMPESDNASQLQDRHAAGQG